MGLVGPDGIVLSAKQDEAWSYLEDPQWAPVQEVFFGGGAGSTKSTLGCLWQVRRRTAHAGTRGFIGRDTYRELKDSTMATFFRMLPEMNYRPNRDWTYRKQDELVEFSNGSEIHFRHMSYEPSDPDFHRFGSTEYTDAFVDEAPGVHQRAVEVLMTRLRFMHVELGLTTKCLLTGNPGDHWVKYAYVMDKNGEFIDLPPHRARVLATLADHPDEAFRNAYSATLENRDPYDKARLLYGDWQAEPRTGREFFHAFDAGKHEKKFDYDPSLPLHISFDFNAVPYMTLLVAQIHTLPLQKYRVHFLQEICLEHPLSNTKATCEAMKMELMHGKYKGHASKLFYYGDATGKARNTMATDEIAHNYSHVEVILRQYLAHNGYSDRTLRRNPPHVVARDFSNDILGGKLPIEISFDPNMHNTIRDMHQLKCAPDGGILKEKVKDTRTGDKYEKGGHCGQAFYYMLCGAFPSIFEEFQSISA